MEILRAIRRTIKYADKYDGHLTVTQLFERLIDKKIYSKGEIVDVLQNNHEVKNRLVEKVKNKIQKDKVEKAKKLVGMIDNKFKDIVFVGITGSVAAGYPKDKDDIDLLIITKANKLWINRLKLRYFVYMNKIPHRRFGEKEKKDDFCFNLWLDENYLEINKNKQNLKNAVDLILMKPILNKDKTYEKFIMSNGWVKKYVATGYCNKISDIRYQISDLEYKNLKGKMIDKVINWLVFWPQWCYMRGKIKTEKVGLHQAFFHN